MNTIKAYLEKVNYSIENNPDKMHILKCALSHFLYLISLTKNCFTETTDELGFTYMRLKKFDTDKEQFKCKEKIPQALTVAPRNKKESTKYRSKYEELYPSLFETRLTLEKYKENLKAEFTKYVNSWNWLKVKIDGTWRAFLVNEKGTPGYNKKMYWRIHDFSKECDKHFKNKRFITLTMAQKAYFGNRRAAWEVFNKAVGKYCKDMQRSLGGEYVCAIESTEKGFPHAHLIFYSNDNFIDPPEQWDNFKKATCLCHGDFFDLDAKNWSLGMTVLKVNNRQSTCNYLAKYLSKGTEEYFLSLRDKEKWSPTDRKEAATLFLTKIFAVRQFRFSKGKFEKEESPQETCLNESLESTKKESLPPREQLSEKSVSEVEDFRTLLKALWNKSPLNCSREIYTWSTKDFEKYNFKSPMQLEKLSLVKNEYYGKKGVRISCNGCILSELYDFVMHGKDDIFKTQKNTDRVFALLSNPHPAESSTAQNPYNSIKDENMLYQKYLEDNKRELEMVETDFSEVRNRIKAEIKHRVESVNKNIPVEDFIQSLYTVHPLIYRFVCPKEWEDCYNALTKDKNRKDKWLAQDKKVYRLAIDSMFFHLL